MESERSPKVLFAYENHTVTAKKKVWADKNNKFYAFLVMLKHVRNNKDSSLLFRPLFISYAKCLDPLPTYFCTQIPFENANLYCCQLSAETLASCLFTKHKKVNNQTWCQNFCWQKSRLECPLISIDLKPCDIFSFFFWKTRKYFQNKIFWRVHFKYSLRNESWEVLFKKRSEFRGMFK